MKCRTAGEKGMVTRGGFIASLAATALCGATRNSLAENAFPALRFGVLSDVHVSSDAETADLIKALSWFDGKRVDAVLIAGDLCTWGKIVELEAFARAWYRVFPNDRRSDGVKVERLFVTGNHDVDGFAYPGAGFHNEDEARPRSFYYQREDVWRRLFGEEYRPVSVKHVKGYAFVLRNWLSILGHDDFEGKWCNFADEPNPLAGVMAGLKLPGDRPFFYVQHDPIDDTVNATWLVGGSKWNNGQDRGEAMSVLRNYPNCFAFTGHSHNSLTDPRSIWQKTFTAVNCSALTGWAFTPPGRENGFSSPDFRRDPPMEMPPVDIRSVRQGMLVDVWTDRVELARHDFVHDVPVGEPWIVPLYGARTVPLEGLGKYDFKRRSSLDAVPSFPADAVVTARRVPLGRRRAKDRPIDGFVSCAQVVVSFPSVTRLVGSSVRAYDFSVKCESRDGDVTRIVDERRVFSPGALQAEEFDREDCRCCFPDEVVPHGVDVRFVVAPMNVWGRAGKPLASAWLKL